MSEVTSTAYRIVPAPVGQAWRAATDPDQVQQWTFGQVPQSTFETGASVDWYDDDGTQLMSGTVVECVVERKLQSRLQALNRDGSPLGHPMTRILEFTVLDPEHTRVDMTFRAIECTEVPASRLANINDFLMDSFAKYVAGEASDLVT